MTPETVMAGKTMFAVVPPAESQKEHGFARQYTFIVERANFPDGWGDDRFFVKVAVDAEKSVYLGELNTFTGRIKMTQNSAFPATAKRVKIADRVFTRIFRRETDVITAAGWKLNAIVSMSK